MTLLDMWLLQKYNSDGTLDNNFGIGGKKSLLIPGFSRVPVFSAINQSDGKIVLAGYCSPSSFNVKKYNHGDAGFTGR